ncbi:UNVERIFIED_CONTAM: hypothetical protein K2H54_007270 [Gekko kuhli]
MFWLNSGFAGFTKVEFFCDPEFLSSTLFTLMMIVSDLVVQEQVALTFQGCFFNDVHFLCCIIAPFLSKVVWEADGYCRKGVLYLGTLLGTAGLDPKQQGFFPCSTAFCPLTAAPFLPPPPRAVSQEQDFRLQGKAESHTPLMRIHSKSSDLSQFGLQPLFQQTVSSILFFQVLSFDEMDLPSIFLSLCDIRIGLFVSCYQREASWAGMHSNTSLFWFLINRNSDHTVKRIFGKKGFSSSREPFSRKKQ